MIEMFMGAMMKMKIMIAYVMTAVGLFVLSGCTRADETASVETVDNQQAAQVGATTESLPDRLPQDGPDFMSSEWSVRVRDVAPMYYLVEQPSGWDGNTYFAVFLTETGQQIAEFEFHVYAEAFTLALGDNTGFEVDGEPAQIDRADSGAVLEEFRGGRWGYSATKLYWYFVESFEAGTIVTVLIHEDHTALITEQFEFIRS